MIGTAEAAPYFESFLPYFESFFLRCPYISSSTNSTHLYSKS